MLPQGTATPRLAVPLPTSQGPRWTLMMTWMSPGQGWASPGCTSELSGNSDPPEAAGAGL